MRMAVIPVLIVFLGVPLFGVWLIFFFRRMENYVRIAAIEKGLPIGERARDVASRTRRTGIVLLSAGLGLCALACVLPHLGSGQGAKVSIGFAILPISIGIGFLIDYKLQLRDLSREEKARS